MTTHLRYRLDTLESLGSGIGDQQLVSELAEIREKLAQEKINLVVLGLFKRGKSSLVNSLLGCPLAPVGVTPLTAIITSFEHDPEKSFARVCFNDGRHLDTAVAGISAYVSEEENPANEKGVSVVRIFDRVLPVLQTMTLIDTPGLGSAYTHNTATTLDFIPRIDAALFVLSADLPVSQADIEFLKTLRQTVPAILFVLNKKDLLSGNELRQLLVHDQRIIVEQVGLSPGEVQIIPVSARDFQQGKHASANIDALRDRIRAILEEGGGALFEEVIARRIGRACEHLRFLLRLRLETLQLPVQELGDRRRRLEEIPRLLDSQKDDFEVLLRGQARRLQDHVRDVLQKESDILREGLSDKILSVSGNAESFRDKCAVLTKEILDRLESARSSLEVDVKERFDHLLRQYAGQPDSFLWQVTRQFSEVMGLPFDIIAKKFDLEVYAPYYQSTDAGPLPAPKSSLFRRSPFQSIRRKRFYRRLLAYYQELILRNCASAMYNLDYRIQESLRKFASALDQRLRELIGHLDALLAEAVALQAGYAPALAENIQKIREKLDAVDDLQQSLHPITQPSDHGAVR
ncbi:MAG TPA: dynamin family protein [Puia sp.]|nr:dynamin family protein [Puia sp.]